MSDRGAQLPSWGARRAGLVAVNPTAADPKPANGPASRAWQGAPSVLARALLSSTDMSPRQQPFDPLETLEMDPLFEEEEEPTAQGMILPDEDQNVQRERQWE
jgi:hypothetical protein